MLRKSSRIDTRTSTTYANIQHVAKLLDQPLSLTSSIYTAETKYSIRTSIIVTHVITCVAPCMQSYFKADDWIAAVLSPQRPRTAQALWQYSFAFHAELEPFTTFINQFLYDFSCTLTQKKTFNVLSHLKFILSLKGSTDRYGEISRDIMTHGPLPTCAGYQRARGRDFGVLYTMYIFSSGLHYTTLQVALQDTILLSLAPVSV